MKTSVNYFSILLTVATFIITTEIVFADKNSQPVIGHVSQDQLKKACKKAGGSFDVVEDSYSCIAKKGSVTCDKKQCTSTPKDFMNPKSKKRPKVLQEGGGGGQGGNVSPTVLGSDPGAPPVGGGGLED
jgi:hypothetical protein